MREKKPGTVRRPQTSFDFFLARVVRFTLRGDRVSLPYARKTNWTGWVRFAMAGETSLRTSGMRIGFQGAAINERGMSVAVYDYASGVQEQLGHEAVVFYDKQKSNADVLRKFAGKFRMIGYEGAEDFRSSAEAAHLDFCYFITGGQGAVPCNLAERTGIHAVFRHFEPSADVYAYVSKWLADWMTGGQAPHVPHIVDLPAPSEDFRAEHGIPADAFVVGRYGGFDQFNLDFAKTAVRQALEKRNNLYLVFLNTEPFVAHERALFLPARVTLQEKSNFIHACDAGLNAKKIGESFGLANAEFLACGKPVFTWAGGMDQNHVHLSPSETWVYRNRADLLCLLLETQVSARDTELARASTSGLAPAPVMRQFDKVFLSGDYRAQDLSLSPAFRLKRWSQEKALRAKFRFWKMS
ncbi:hypothetical protein [Roseibium sp. RKSG952]|uniref:hypothetical protein n=1 Tax=Roseibium sp. RKSG952 TaxID=2529384 RepID=UPI0012BBC67D|nr:hypothetical protein [Roseibium sp. RKSG952]MTH97659.1 hypothetical protein [Roseibium sp. RKSG952]